MAGVKFREIKKDTGTSARVGLLTLNGYRIQTPVLWLGHNFQGPVSVWKQDSLLLPGVLVNACEILKSATRRESIQKIGIHRFLDYPGPVMMDSGGFLFQQNQQVTVSPHEITELYKEAEIDIAVSLDHPLNPTSPACENRRRWRLTLRNTELMAGLVTSSAFMPVLHGYTLPSLKIACKEIRKIFGDPPLVGLGSLVPLMKASHLGKGFRYLRTNGQNGDHVTYMSDAVKLVRDEFPGSLLHVFGVGSTTTVLSMFALGADSADSVAWRLKAAYGAIQLPGTSDRFLSPRPNSRKSRPVINKQERKLLAECICPICRRYKTLRSLEKYLDNNFKARTIHNAWVFTQEVSAFKTEVLNGAGLAFISKRLSAKHRLYPLHKFSP